MLYLDEDAVICDLAETYHILNYEALSPALVGVLACGLDSNSRIKRKMSGQSISTDTMLWAIIADRLGILLWRDTKDGRNGVNLPDSLLYALMGHEKDNDNMSFETGEDFDRHRERLLNGK